MSSGALPLALSPPLAPRSRRRDRGCSSHTQAHTHTTTTTTAHAHAWSNSSRGCSSQVHAHTTPTTTAHAHHPRSTSSTTPAAPAGRSWALTASSTAQASARHTRPEATGISSSGMDSGCVISSGMKSCNVNSRLQASCVSSNVSSGRSTGSRTSGMSSTDLNNRHVRRPHRQSLLQSRGDGHRPCVGHGHGTWGPASSNSGHRGFKSGSGVRGVRSVRGVRGVGVARASSELQEFTPDDFSVDRLLGTLGFMNVSSYTPPLPGQWGGESAASSVAAGLSIEDINRMAERGVGEGAVQIRIYRGRIARGPRYNTRVILKAYPGRSSPGYRDADALSANELVTHFALQGVGEEEDSDRPPLSPYVSVLLGGFETSTGEKWLVLRDDGFLTAADYARFAAQASASGEALGNWEFMDRFDPSRPLRRRQAFVIELLRGAFQGLAYMHAQGKLHQSLGPASVVLNTVDEMDVNFLVPRLRDFAFSVDISDPAVLSGTGSRSVGAVQEARDGLWGRARAVSASSILEKKAFGIADDIYSGGLLLAYMAFLPFCPPGSIDGPSLQRLLETTFQLDIQAAREYCVADERWNNAVEFLDRNNGSGWDLLQAMLNPDFRLRPAVETVLRHPFFN